MTSFGSLTTQMTRPSALLTDIADLVLRKISAHLAIAHLLFCVDDGRGKCARLLFRHVDDAVGIPLRRLFTHAPAAWKIR